MKFLNGERVCTTVLQDYLINREKFSRGSRSYLVVTCDVNMLVLQIASKVPKILT